MQVNKTHQDRLVSSLQTEKVRQSGEPVKDKIDLRASEGDGCKLFDEIADLKGLAEDTKKNTETSDKNLRNLTEHLHSISIGSGDKGITGSYLTVHSKVVDIKPYMYQNPVVSTLQLLDIICNDDKK